MSQNAEPKLEQPLLHDPERAERALEESLRAAAAAQSRNEPSSHQDHSQEITKENIGVDRKSVAPEAHLETRLSSKLDRYRERLTDKASPPQSPLAEMSLQPERSAEDGKLKPLRPSKSEMAAEAQGKNVESKVVSNVQLDPLGFIADLIKKLEGFILGKLSGAEEELDALPKAKIMVKRKKKKGGSSLKEKTGLYHLDNAQEEEELVDLETALAEGGTELTVSGSKSDISS